MTLWRRWAAGLPGYVWGGWGAVAGLMLMLALWEAVASRYGPLILPDPLQTFERMAQLARESAAWESWTLTARRAAYGLGLALLAGSVLGMVAGLSVTASVLSRTWITVMLGMPPVGWLVLALLWFGSGDGTPVFTVFVACFPVVFVNAMQGTRTLDVQLRDLARSLRLPWWMMLTDVYLPHVLSYLFAAFITALGTSWKVVVMAELLASSDGVGAALASSRAQLDTVTTMAWIGMVVGALLLVEYGLLEPVRRELERWRTLDAPATP